jgi:endonuclease I
MIKKINLFLLFIAAGSLNGFAQKAGYYNGTEGKAGVELKSALHGIIKGHIDFSYSDAKYILNYADQDPAIPANIIYIYSKRSRPISMWGTTAADSPNREHVWAKSHGNFVDIRPMDGDAFNLHPEGSNTNILRSNYDFDECSATGTLIPEANSYYTSTQFEPQDAAKGEAARTLFYMAVRYEGTDNEIDLEMADQVGNYPTPKFGKLSTLLQWNNDFPPTDLERRRNERVSESQRNRNPFIDHPEYANMIWSSAAAPIVSIGTISMSPEYPVASETATVSASISSSAGGISSAILYYGSTYNSEEFSSSMTESGGVWSGSIDFTHFTANTYAYYKITATDGTNTGSTTGNYLIPAVKTITPITAVQGTGASSPLAGTAVTISGIVTSNLDNTFYIQSSGNPYSGMCVYDMRRGRIGDSVVVTGNVTEYNSLTEVDGVSYVYTYGHKRFIEPKVLTIAEVNENYEGMLVTIKNVTFLDGDKVIPLAPQSSLSFTDGSKSMIVFARVNSRIGGKVLPSGSVDVTGVVSQYGAAYQILVNDISDIKAGFDNQAPIISNLIVNSMSWIEVSFNENLNTVTAQNIANYSFTSGLNIVGAYMYGGTKVLLLVSGIKPIDYTLTVNGVKDMQGNTMSGVTKTFHSNFEDPAYTTISCINDTIVATDKSLININVISNDTLPSSFDVSINKKPAFGYAIVNPDYSISYLPFTGGVSILHDTIFYEVCNSIDPLKCEQAIVYISINNTIPFSCNNDNFSGSQFGHFDINVIENDSLPAIFDFSIIRAPVSGIATIAADYTISYDVTAPKDIIFDTIVYKVCDANSPDYCFQATVYITVDYTISIYEYKLDQVILWPNPVMTELQVLSKKSVSRIEILDLTGKMVVNANPQKSGFSVPMLGLKGVYIVRMTMDSGEVIMKKVVKL